MKPGTLIRLPDGREGTVVYHGLDGYGIKWGRHRVPVNELNLFKAGDEWAPEAMLREPYPGAELECVGEEYERDDHDMPFSGSMESRK